MRLSTALYALILITSALHLGACLPAAVSGARALLPAQPDEDASLWVWIESADRHMTGVYRCHDEGERVRCLKAELVEPEP